MTRTGGKNDSDSKNTFKFSTFPNVKQYYILEDYFLFCYVFSSRICMLCCMYFTFPFFCCQLVNYFSFFFFASRRADCSRKPESTAISSQNEDAGNADALLISGRCFCYLAPVLRICWLTISQLFAQPEIFPCFFYHFYFPGGNTTLHSTENYALSIRIRSCCKIRDIIAWDRQRKLIACVGLPRSTSVVVRFFLFQNTFPFIFRLRTNFWFALYIVHDHTFFDRFTFSCSVCTQFAFQLIRPNSMKCTKLRKTFFHKTKKNVGFVWILA